jgi:hypothetical protein
MTQGRKSKTVTGIGRSLTALLAVALLAPALAGAQAVDDEYNLTLPTSEGGNGGSTDVTQSAASRGGSGADVADTATTAPTPEATTNATSSSEGAPVTETRKRDKGKPGPASDDAAAAPKADAPPATPAVTSAPPADDGGAPILLIVLAGGAAIFAGVAVWRLRGRTLNRGGEIAGIGEAP